LIIKSIFTILEEKIFIAETEVEQIAGALYLVRSASGSMGAHLRRSHPDPVQYGSDPLTVPFSTEWFYTFYRRIGDAL
jgi:hypothetical protein